MGSRPYRLAMPVATLSVRVAPSSSAELTNTSRATVSGIHTAPKPSSSICAAYSPACDEGTASRVPVQMP